MELIPVSGFSLVSLIRGFLGISVLILIAFLLSNNRKAISWKTVGVGLFIQFIVAFGVLKVKLIKNIFETAGNFFIKVLEYTGEGTKMLLGEFGDVDEYGFIFIFQALGIGSLYLEY